MREAAPASDGPDVRMMRRRGSAAASRHTRSTNDADGQRRKGLPALTCSTMIGLSGPIPASASRRSTAVDAAAILRASQADRRSGSGGANAERQQHVPLAHHRVARPQRARPGHARRVHPASSGDLVADPHRRTARPREQRAARAAVKIDRQVVAARAGAGGSAPGRRAAVRPSEGCWRR